jgi:uncharacterized surface anchored protein
MAGKFKFEVITGATFRKRFTYKAGSSAVNLTGAVIKFEVTPEGGNASPAQVFSTATGHIVIDNAAAGKFSLTLTATETAAFTFSRARYILTITFTNGDVVRLLEGTISRRV